MRIEVVQNKCDVYVRETALKLKNGWGKEGGCYYQRSYCPWRMLPNSISFSTIDRYIWWTGGTVG